MKKFFYSDPLAAAWMAKHFGMKFVFQGVCAADSFTAQNGYMAEVTIREMQQTGGMGDSPAYIRIDFGDWEIPKKHYIHPDSLHLLRPKLWDIIAYPSKADKNKEFRLCHQLTNSAVVDAAEYTWHSTTQIIQRNGTPFFWPESEE